MEKAKKYCCRLCLNSISDEKFEIIKGITWDVLDILLLKLNLDKKITHKICSVCSVKLSAAFDFKSVCLYADHTIIPYVTYEKVLPIDLRDVYIKEKGEGQFTGIPGDQKVCRLCIKIISGGCMPVQDLEANVIRMYIPEVNFSATKDPVICTPCVNALDMHGSFVKDCLEAQEEFNNTGDDVTNTVCASSRNIIKREIIEIKPEPNGGEENEADEQEHCEVILFKTEEIEIKTEIIDQESLESTEHSLPKVVKRKRKRRPYGEYPSTREYDCGICDHRTTYKKLSIHRSTHKDSMGLYKCTFCDYRSKLIQVIKYHISTHKNNIRGEDLKCGICGYKTKCRKEYETHRKTHKDSTNLFKCDFCSYKSKYSCSITKHVLTHKDPSEVENFKCDVCDYESIFRTSVNKHMRVKHGDPSEVPSYECDLCDYETKYKPSLKKHIAQNHKLSEESIYKCDDCPYWSKYPHNFRLHRLTHEARSEGQYGCSQCDFKTGNKGKLVSHQLLHETHTQVYQCDVCDFRTKTKNFLQRHKKRHEPDFQVEMFKCYSCRFESKRKDRLIGHIKKCHTVAFEDQKIKCEQSL